MRGFYYDFQIDGKPILTPDQDVVMEVSDLDSDESGRDEAGVMHRIVLREGVKKWALSYNILTREEYRYMLSLFKGKPHFKVDYRDADGNPASCMAYHSKHNITIHNARTGTYKNYKVNIIEC